MNATSFKAGLAAFLFSLFAGIQTARAAETVLIPQAAVWQYKYDATGPGEGWRGLDFDASSWRSGPAQLGYGDGDEATRIEFVPGPEPGTERPITAYFRHRFDILDRSVFNSLRLRLVRDDGAVVYLNGVEVARSNMPEGAVGPNTLALSTVGGEFESLPVVLDIPMNSLRGGANVLAVEVHQVTAASSDLSFAAVLLGLNGVTERPTVSVAARVEATSEPTPTTRVAPAVFTLSRAGGDLSRELPVYVRYEGTATRGTDYDETPTRVVIAAGQSEVDVPVIAIADNLAEPTETVTVFILEPPLEPTSVPYNIAADRRSAQVSILNAGNPVEPVVVSLVASVANTSEPLPNALVAPGVFRVSLSRAVDQSLQVILGYGGTAAAGTDYEQLPMTVIFAPGETAKTLTVLPRADELVEGPETVVAELATPDPAAYVVNAEARRAVVTIADEDRAPQARIEITRPVTGEVFQRGATIGIRAVAVDPAGYIPRVEFFAGDTRIGVSEVTFVTAPEPGTPIAHEMSWALAPTGQHHLRARGIAANGQVVTSAEVTISVIEYIPTVSMRFLPLPQAVMDMDFVLGAIEVRRTGTTAQALQVFYRVNEVAVAEMPLATPGVDYERLPGWVVIEAGQEAAIIMPHAIDDELPEPREAIALELMPPPPNVDPAYPSVYRINAEASSAVAYILDNDTEEDATLTITAPTDGQVFTDSAAIRIRAVAVDPRGYVSRVEFWAGAGRIGVSEIAHVVEPAPGTPAEHEFIWQNAPNGVHELTARCVTTSGDSVRSAAVTITIRDEDPEIPIVSIGEATFGVFPNGNYDSSPGVLEVRRTGPTTAALQVYYRVAEVSVPERPLATPGVDYERLPGYVVIAAGQTSAFIRPTILDDTTPELREYIDIQLTGVPPHAEPANPVDPPYPVYQVDPEHDEASLYIIDNDGPVSPSVRIAQPRSGAVFTVGQTIEIRAELASVANFSRIEILGDGQVIESFDSFHAGYWAIWRNVAAGAHTISAKLYAGGAVVQAEAVQILVREATDSAFVHRSLPDSYQPGSPVSVELGADLPAGARAYAVEDRPPVGWTVSNISHEGVYDGVTGKVKFGPFTDGEDRVLRYVARPPENAEGIREFEGTSSLDGHAYAIGGDRVIRPGSVDHPADRDSNNVLTITEVTAYAAAWRSGETWPTPPTPIPVSFVTRAGYIWRNGENYIFQPSAGAAPYCWTPGTAESVIIVTGPPADPVWLASATRAVAGPLRPGVAAVVDLTVQPPSGTAAHAIEERVPAGWSVSEISADGTFDAATSTIRWGVFYDTNERILTYKITPPANVASVGRFNGRLSADGSTYIVTGNETMVAVNEEDRPRLTELRSEIDGGVTLRLSGPAGQVGILQYSIDLEVWEDVGEIYLPGGSAEFTAETGGRTAGYYRLQIR